MPYTGKFEYVLHTARSFFGVYRIKPDEEKRYHFLFHGTTIHGIQSLDPGRRHEPLSYFHRSGPIGQVFSALSARPTKPHVAVIGLGTGSLACYGESGQQFTFYEIDPTVERIARDPRYFTFLQDCPPRLDVVLGDARLSLTRTPDRYFGLIVLDAFSSDAIPVHLLTREALKLYLAKLEEGGILAFHISNRYLDLRPVLGNLAQEAGLFCLVRNDLKVSEGERRSGKRPSIWVVMARKQEDVNLLAQDQQWKVLTGQAGAKVWTDDFSDILSVIRWN